MRRGTTPTITVSVDADITDMNIHLAFKCGSRLIVKQGDDLTVEAVEGGEDVHAITDGTLVYLSAGGGAMDYVNIPSSYTPVCMSLGTAVSDDQTTVLACYVDNVGSARAVDGSRMLFLTVVYPIA